MKRSLKTLLLWVRRSHRSTCRRRPRLRPSHTSRDRKSAPIFQQPKTQHVTSCRFLLSASQAQEEEIAAE